MLLLPPLFRSLAGMISALGTIFSCSQDSLRGCTRGWPSCMIVSSSSCGSGGGDGGIHLPRYLDLRLLLLLLAGRAWRPEAREETRKKSGRSTGRQVTVMAAHSSAMDQSAPLTCL